MLLQERSSHIRRDGTLDSFLHDGSLLFAPCHEPHFRGTHDRGNSHGDSRLGHIIKATEGRSGVRLCQVIEGHLPSDRRVIRPGLIEADMTGAPDAENLQVEPAACLNLCLVGGTMCRYVRRCQRAAGQIHVLGLDVDVIEEIVVHEVPVRLRVLVRQSRVFIQVESGHVSERKPFFLVQANQLCVEGERCSSGGKPKHNPFTLSLPCAYKLSDFSCQYLGGFLWRIEYFVCHSTPIVCPCPRISTLK